MGVLMPAIYTFSLDFGRDRDLIDLLESKKNRSDYIRTVLRKDDLSQMHIDLFHHVYSLYSTAMEVHAGREPQSKESLMSKVLDLERNPSKDLERNPSKDCFTCSQVGEDKCHICN